MRVKCILKAEENMSLRRLMCIWTDNIRLGFKHISFEAVDQIFVSEVSDHCRILLFRLMNILVS